MKLWLDDIRDPREHGHIGWVWVKTASEAIELLKSKEITEASLDHDLGWEQTVGMESSELTGYTVVCWLEINPDCWPINGVKVHSMNPYGKQRMESVIKKYGGMKRLDRNKRI